MVLDYNILYDTVKRAVEAGVKIGLASTGAIKPFLNRSEAEKQYGKQNIKKWIEEGRLNPNRDGSASNLRIKRADLELLSLSSNIGIVTQAINKPVSAPVLTRKRKARRKP